MKKKTLTLVIISILISVGLLWQGTTVMAKFSPILASSQNPLIARLASVTSLNGNTTNPTITEYDQPLIVVTTSTSELMPATSVTIAELLANPNLYSHELITINGIATMLGDGKFLLNDGTGQILIDADDDLDYYTSVNGLFITVTGKLDGSSDEYGFQFESCTISDENGTIVVDDCDSDDLNDDMNDDMDDDMNDDMDDDMDDDMNEDMNDDMNDDMDDDDAMNDDMDDDDSDD